MRVLDNAWSLWVKNNVERGCSHDQLARILIENGFGALAARSAIENAARTGEGRGPAKAPTVHTLPGSRPVPCSGAELYVADGFLDAAECQTLIELMHGKLRASTLASPNEPDPVFRTSRTCDIGCLPHEAVRRLERRICSSLGTVERYAEPAQGQHYEEGGEFKPHTDYFEACELERYLTPTLGQRSWTFMVYLNEPTAGGETAFLNAGVVISPKTGRAVIWNNLGRDGRPNPGTLHHGMPVKAGRKDIITKWFRVPR